LRRRPHRPISRYEFRQQKVAWKDMERWIHNARMFSARGGLLTSVMRVPGRDLKPNPCIYDNGTNPHSSGASLRGSQASVPCLLSSPEPEPETSWSSSQGCARTTKSGIRRPKRNCRGQWFK
jgi:hypothetical protein